MKMTDEIILEAVNNATIESEIDVLIAITESYQKVLTILECSDYDESVIQESFSLYMESDDEEGKESSIKNLFKRIISFFKSVCSKISDLIQRCFNKNKRYYMATYNVLMIVDEMNRIFSSKTFNEYVSGEIDDEVFQEALFGRTKSEAEKEQNEIDKRQKAQEKEINKRMNKEEKENEKNTKAYDKEYKKFIRTLRRKFKPESFFRELSRKDIKDIVKVVCLGCSKNELTKLRNAVNDIAKGNFENVDDNIYETLKLLTYTSKSVGTFKKHAEHNRMRKNVVISDKQRNAALNKIDSNTSQKSSFDLALLDKFADTFGVELNRLSGRDHFSAENLKALVYGPNKIFTIPATIVTFTTSTVFNLLTKAAFALSMFNPKMIIDGIRDCGRELDHLDDEFDKFASDDKILRKELGVRLNRTMDVVRFGAIDNIAEETYRWRNCPFNSLTYGTGNEITTIAGGPITLTVILISTIVFHRSLEEFFPSIGTLVMMGFAKSMNPTGYSDYK